MIIFDSYAEAQEELKERNHARSQREEIFCPLINGQCNKNCVCYSEGFVVRVSDGRCVISGSNCQNAMLFGD